MGFGFKNYAADQVKLTIAGIPIDSGFGDGTFVTISPTNPFFGSVAGTDGEVTRWKSSDRRAEGTIVLMQTSDGHQALSVLHTLDRNAPNGAGVGVFQLEDLNGGTNLLSPSCWITGFPEISYAREAGAWEWPFEVSHLDGLIAGT